MKKHTPGKDFAGTENIYNYDAAAAREGNLIGRRLQEARKARGLSADDVSAILADYGISVLRGSVSKWELGITVPNSYQLLALCMAFGIDDAAAYFAGSPLLNDAGMKKLAEYKKDLVATGLYSPAPPMHEIIYREMKVSDLRVSAGTGEFLDDENFDTVRCPADAVPTGADFGVRIHGDSMEPAYTDGQLVWVQTCKSLRRGEVGIFIYDGCGYIKMYDERIPDDAEAYIDSGNVLHMQPVLVSWNEAYSPIAASPDKRLEIIGRVL